MPEPMPSPTSPPLLPPPPPPARHGSAVAWCGRGVLLLGPSGTGKSALLLGLVAAGAYLVADDLVRLARRGPALVAAAVPPTGLIELRGGGIFRLATTSEVPLGLCVELQGAAGGLDRLPERRTTAIDGVTLPCLHLQEAGPAAVAAVLLALAARRAA